MSANVGKTIDRIMRSHPFTDSDQSHFCCKFWLHSLNRTQFEWFWWHLWQEFPTVLDITGCWTTFPASAVVSAVRRGSPRLWRRHHQSRIVSHLWSHRTYFFEQVHWVACVSEDLKCWGAWDTICRHTAKDITPSNIFFRASALWDSACETDSKGTKDDVTSVPWLWIYYIN